MHIPNDNQQAMTTISSTAADILAHLRSPGAYMAAAADENLVALEQSNNAVMRIPTHHTLQPPPLSSPHLRVTLPEPSVSANNQVALQSHQIHQSNRHLLPLTAAIQPELAQMQQVTPSTVGMQPMDMTSSSVMSMAGQGQHDQTVQSFPGMMQTYNQNYVH